MFTPFLESAFDMKLVEIREAVFYVAKFMGLNLELEPPDCSALGEDPEDVSDLLAEHSNLRASALRIKALVPGGSWPADLTIVCGV